MRATLLLGSTRTVGTLVPGLPGDGGVRLDAWGQNTQPIGLRFRATLGEEPEIQLALT